MQRHRKAYRSGAETGLVRRRVTLRATNPVPDATLLRDAMRAAISAPTMKMSAAEMRLYNQIRNRRTQRAHPG